MHISWLEYNGLVGPTLSQGFCVHPVRHGNSSCSNLLGLSIAVLGGGEGHEALK